MKKEKIKEIKFSYDYFKLPEDWNGTQAVLLGLEVITDVDNWKKKFPQLIEFDTKFRGKEGHYNIDFKEGLLLFFFHLNAKTLFTTIRRYTLYKQEYYEDSIFDTFKLVKI